MLSVHRIVSCLVLFSVLFSATGSAAEEESLHAWVGGLEPIDLTGTTQVNIDVFVRDHDGVPVLGLERDQFEVQQGGRVIPVTRFDAHTDGTSDSELTALLRPPVEEELPETTEPIYMVLYVDNGNLRTTDRNRVLGPMLRFAESVLQGEARIMVVTHGTSLEVIQPFTRDPREVTRAIRYVRTMETSLEQVDNQHMGIQRSIRRAVTDRTRTSTARNQVLSNLFGEIQSFGQQEEFRLAMTLQGIYELGTMLTGINGRKYLVYISNGMPLVVVKDLFHEFAALDSRAASASLSTAYNKRRHYERLAAAANAQKITIYTIDATGPYSTRGSIGSSNSARSTSAATVRHQNEIAPLKKLAEDTGGLAIVNSDDFESGFDRLKGDLLTYYSLGYDIETSGADTVHAIDVAIRSAENEDYELRYRKTFIEKSIASRVQEKANGALFFDIDDNPMDLKVTGGAQQPATPGRWMKPLKISFPKRFLAMVPDGEDYVGTAVIFIATRDVKGRSTDILRRTRELRIPVENYEEQRNERFYIGLSLLLEAGRHQVAVGVLDPLTNRASYQKTQVFVNNTEATTQ